MTIDPLLEPSRRLAWAKGRLEELKTVAQTFLDTEPHSLFHETDPATGDHLIRVRVERLPSFEIGFLAGDCIHHIRASLDNLAWGLALRHCAPKLPPGYTAFPIYRLEKSPPRKPGQRSSPAWDPDGLRKCEGMDGAVVREIRALQPYHRGAAAEDDKLWILDRLWNDDKHKAIHVVGGGVLKNTIKAHAFGGFTDVIAAPPGAFDDGDELMRLVRDPTRPVDVKLEGELSSSVAFSKGSAARGAIVYETIRDLYEYVRDKVFPVFA
jgi:hypothetical protein